MSGPSWAKVDAALAARVKAKAKAEPDASYGDSGIVPKLDVDETPDPDVDETPDDDEELAETPAYVVEILGFDPAKEPE